MDSLSKRDSAEARNMLKKRGAYPKSGARCVRRCPRTQDSFGDTSYTIYRIASLNAINWQLSPKDIIRVSFSESTQIS